MDAMMLEKILTDKIEFLSVIKLSFMNIISYNITILNFSFRLKLQNNGFFI